MPTWNEYERVLYKKNPLDAVICQVRFPTILRVESEIPSAFQERIRNDFPLFIETSDQEMAIPAEITRSVPPEIAKIIGRQLDVGGGRKYRFLSENRVWQVTLTRDSLSFACRKYEKWEQFQSQLERPLTALLDIYKPSFFSRVGLRYRDIIRRSTLGLDDRPWAALLKQHIAGELGDQDIASHIKHTAKETLFDLPDEAHARMQHGFIKLKEEQGYLIDTDFYTTRKTEVSDVTRRIGTFNKYARWVFRWCISDELHNAMVPERI